MKTAIPVRRQSHSHTHTSGRALLISSVLAFALFALAGCASPQAEEGVAPVASEPPQGAEETNTEPVVVRATCTEVPLMSFSELLEKAELIVQGVVESKSEAFLIEPVDGTSPQFFTDVFFSVEAVYAGTPHYDSESDAQSARLTVRTEGGAGNLVKMTNDATPDFQNGQRYLLFLYQVDDGSDYNTEGNHYYVIGYYIGAWLESETAGEFKRTVPPFDSIDRIDKETLLQKIADAPFPVGVEKEDLGITAVLPEIEEDFQKGSISQEAYESYVQLAEKESSTFARIMTDEEQQAYEQEEVARMKEYSSSMSS